MAETRWQAIDFEKGTRYYRIILHQDLWHRWVVTKVWGGKGRKAQYVRHEPQISYEKAITRLRELADYREHRRKYHLEKTNAIKRIV